MKDLIENSENGIIANEYFFDYLYRNVAEPQDVHRIFEKLKQNNIALEKTEWPVSVPVFLSPRQKKLYILRFQQFMDLEDIYYHVCDDNQSFDDFYTEFIELLDVL